MSAESIPDEIWIRILETGVQTGNLTHKDLSCLSISCRRLHSLSREDSLWAHLLASHFPGPTTPSSSSSSSSSSQTAFKDRYERERRMKAMAHRRAVLRKESQVWEHQRRVRDLEACLVQENDKLRSASSQLGNLLKARQASVALNVWQPEIVRDRQRQVVEQCAVPVESRVRSLEMEVRVCRHQISTSKKRYMDEKRRLEVAKQELASLKYHPLRDYDPTQGGDSNYDKKRKNSKKCMTLTDDKRRKCSSSEIQES